MKPKALTMAVMLALAEMDMGKRARGLRVALHNAYGLVLVWP